MKKVVWGPCLYPRSLCTAREGWMWLFVRHFKWSPCLCGTCMVLPCFHPVFSRTFNENEGPWCWSLSLMPTLQLHRAVSGTIWTNFPSQSCQKDRFRWGHLCRGESAKMSSGEVVLNIFYSHKRSKPPINDVNLKRIKATITINIAVRGTSLSDYSHQLVP